MSNFDFLDFLSWKIRKYQIENIWLFSFRYNIEIELIFLLKSCQQWGEKWKWAAILCLRQCCNLWRGLVFLFSTESKNWKLKIEINFQFLFLGKDVRPLRDKSTPGGDGEGKLFVLLPSPSWLWCNLSSPPCSWNNWRVFYSREFI